MSIPNNFLVKYALDKETIEKENVDRALGDLFDVVRHLAEENSRLKTDAEKKEAEYAALSDRISSLEEEKRIFAAKCETDEKSLRFYMAENQSLIERLNMERSRNNGGFTNEEVFNSIAVMAEEMRRISAVNESVNERMEELGERMDSFIDNCTGRQFAYRYQNHPPYSDNVPAPQEQNLPEEDYSAPAAAEAEAAYGAGMVYAEEYPQETAQTAEEPIPEEILPDEGIPTEPEETEVFPEIGTDYPELRETETEIPGEPEPDPEMEVEIVELPDPEMEVEIVELPDTEPEESEETAAAELPDEPVFQELDIRMFDQSDIAEMPAEAETPEDIPAEEYAPEETAEDQVPEEFTEEEPAALPEELIAVPEEPASLPEEPIAVPEESASVPEEPAEIPEEPAAEAEETPEENPEVIPVQEADPEPDAARDAEKTQAISEIAEKLRRQAMQAEPAPETEKPETPAASARDSVYASLKSRLDRINQNSKFKK